MTNEEYIQELIERDKPYPMGRDVFFVPGGTNESVVELCGRCDHTVVEPFVFCPWCGQRIDHTLYKL